MIAKKVSGGGVRLELSLSEAVKLHTLLRSSSWGVFVYDAYDALDGILTEGDLDSEEI